MGEIVIAGYSDGMAADWNSFVDSSRNGTFLLRRDYMDYHAERFEDHSAVFFRRGKMIALIPGAVAGEDFISHPGLTYGGLVCGMGTTGAEVLDMLTAFSRKLRGEGLRRMIYKPVPHIYHRFPAEEDLYALFRLGAVLTARSLSSALLLPSDGALRRIRQCGVRRAVRCGITMERTSDFAPFWSLLTRNLRERHGVDPVHTLAEIAMLAERFPDNIRLYVAKRGDETVAGTVVYETAEVIHTQYISASPEGRECGALDFLMSRLIAGSSGKRYFDFGISCEAGGRVLNHGLLYQKEGFGARGVCYDSYTVDLTSIPS